jgi:hypothetical protein
MTVNERFDRDAMSALNAAGAPYRVGGAYTFERYAAIAPARRSLMTIPD